MIVTITDDDNVTLGVNTTISGQESSWTQRIIKASQGQPKSEYLDFQFQTFRLNLKVFGDFNKIHGGPERAPITDDDNVTLGVNTTISWEIYRARISFGNDQIPTRTESHLHLIVLAALQ